MVTDCRLIDGESPVAVLDCGHTRPVELSFTETERQELIAFLESPEGRRKKVPAQNPMKNEVTYVEEV